MRGRIRSHQPRGGWKKWLSRRLSVLQGLLSQTNSKFQAGELIRSSVCLSVRLFFPSHLRKLPPLTASANLSKTMQCLSLSAPTIRSGARFNLKKIILKILLKILTKFQFEKEICINYWFLQVFIFPIESGPRSVIDFQAARCAPLAFDTMISSFLLKLLPYMYHLCTTEEYCISREILSTLGNLQPRNKRGYTILNNCLNLQVHSNRFATDIHYCWWTNVLPHSLSEDTLCHMGKH